MSMEWVNANESLPCSNRIVIAYLEGWQGHSGVTWVRKGYSKMVRWGDDVPKGPNETDAIGWSREAMSNAMKEHGADFLLVTHWAYITVPPGVEPCTN